MHAFLYCYLPQLSFSLHDLQQLIAALKQTENRWPAAAVSSSFFSLAQIILSLLQIHRCICKSPGDAEEQRVVRECLPLHAKLAFAFFFTWRVSSNIYHAYMHACMRYISYMHASLHVIYIMHSCLHAWMPAWDMYDACMIACMYACMRYVSYMHACMLA